VGVGGAQLRRGSAFLVERASRAVSVPCLSIYSLQDNVVHPPATSMLAKRGAQDHAVAHAGHLAILFDPDVVRAVVDFVGAPDAVDAKVAMPSAAPTQKNAPGPLARDEGTGGISTLHAD
jgi:hypothetical protein